MPLDLLDRASLQQAQAEVIQTRTAAEKDAARVTAINKPINKGSDIAKTAVQNSFASADAADAAAVKAKALAATLAAKLAESITAAEKAAKDATRIKVAAELAYTMEAAKLNEQSEKADRAIEDAKARAAEAVKAVLPADMTAKLARLKSKENEAKILRDASEAALVAARLEITQAQARFNTATTVADATVRCKQGYLSRAYYGPTVTGEEIAARVALDKATADLEVPDENFKRLKTDLKNAASEHTLYQEKVEAKQAQKRNADAESKKANTARDVLEKEVTTLRAETTRLGLKLPVLRAEDTAKNNEFKDLNKLSTLDAEANSALLVVRDVRSNARGACRVLVLPEDCLEADIDSGAVFTDDFRANSDALTEFNKKDVFGKEARRLGPELDGLPDETAFLAAMANETPVPTSRAIPFGGTQQIMKKWEYPDGTLVRYKPKGDAYSGGLATYSIEVKVDMVRQDHGPADIAFKIDPKGRAIPLGPNDVNNPYGPGAPRETYRDGAMKLGHRSLAPAPVVVLHPVAIPDPVVV